MGCAEVIVHSGERYPLNKLCIYYTKITETFKAAMILLGSHVSISTEIEYLTSILNQS